MANKHEKLPKQLYCIILADVYQFIKYMTNLLPGDIKTINMTHALRFWNLLDKNDMISILDIVHGMRLGALLGEIQ